MSEEKSSGGVAKLNDSAVAAFLKLARVARLATASADGEPHNIPLCYAFDGEHFYFAIDEKPKREQGLKLKRMRNILENPRVALIVDHFEEDFSQLAYVLVHGQAQVVEDAQEYLAALRLLRDKYPQYRVMALSPERNPMVRITPTRVHAWGKRFG